MSENTQFRIHPAIGIARVGNSEDYYLGPETMAGMPSETNDGITGGLPIVKDTESTLISSKELRDAQGKLKRQAARFKIYKYDDPQTNYPAGGGQEVKVGDTIIVNGERKGVTDIIWTVHLANKKANSWIEPTEGMDAFKPTPECPDRSPKVRNPDFKVADPALKENWNCNPTEDETNPNYGVCCDSTKVLGDTNRLNKLIIDAGPQVVGNRQAADFSRTATNRYYDPATQSFHTIAYPKSFPQYPAGLKPDETIDTLGSMKTDEYGRLIVLGGLGKATGFDNDGNYKADVELTEDVNNNNWFDDTADGPVTATIIFEDGTYSEVEGSAWVVTTDPSYAPQIRNVVTLWDDLYNNWLENFNLENSIYDLGTFPNDTSTHFNCGPGYNPNYKPDFNEQVRPILEAADLQRWAVNLKEVGVNAHRVISESTYNNPTRTDLLDFVRNPNDADSNTTPQNATRMPLSLGDAGQDLLSISRTQYFFLRQWMNGMANDAERVLGPGELLDRNVLGNCLGGRFSPGIEMTFIIRDPNLFIGWNGTTGSIPSVGPFRINMKTLDYSKTPLNSPFLGVGYMPLRTNRPVEPGDICKFMSIPWHTDYNSCATHETTPNANDSNMTYWSWPAQRPVAVYTFEDLACYGELSFQRFSLRGEGTSSPNVDAKGNEVMDPYAKVGRYQDRKDYLADWTKVGFIIQAPAISSEIPANSRIPAMEVMRNYYLEVESHFLKDDSNKVVVAPIPANQYTAPPVTSVCPHMSAAKKAE